MAAPKNTLTTLSAADLAAALTAEDGDENATREDAEALTGEPQAAEALTGEPTERGPAVEAGSRASVKAGQRVKKGAAPVAESAMTANVVARITKAGHGKVHTGLPGERYDWNDEVVLPQGVAKALESRALAEIVGNT